MSYLLSVAVLYKLYYVLLRLHSSLCPECGMGLMTQAPHCLLLDKSSYFSPAPRTEAKLPFSNSIFTRLFYSSRCLIFFFRGQQMCSGVVAGSLVINASVIIRRMGAKGFALPSSVGLKIALTLQLLEH